MVNRIHKMHNTTKMPVYCPKSFSYPLWLERPLETDTYSGWRLGGIARKNTGSPGGTLAGGLGSLIGWEQSWAVA